MSIDELLSRLKSERKDLLDKMSRIQQALSAIKKQNLNSQNKAQQDLADGLHRRTLAIRYQCQDELTEINARIKLLYSRMRTESARHRQMED